MPHSFVDRNRLWARLNEALAHAGREFPAPVCVVDLDAFDANATDLARRADGTPVRVVSSSIRVPALLRRATEARGFRGVLAATLDEALWLHDEEGHDDVVVAYPTVDRDALGRLVASPSAASAITVMVDSPAHLDIVDSVRHSKAVPVRVAIDIDGGMRMGRQHVGLKRSPVYDGPAARRLAETVIERAGFRLVGAMTYEGQVATQPDLVPDKRARSLVVRRLKAASLAQLAARRREIAEALADLADLEFWNAGGSGSVAEAAADPLVTEVSAGSGLLVPTLLDHFQSFDPVPALYAGLPVTRRPSPQIATVHGGGFVASGAPGNDRLPTPWAPPGLQLTGLEAAGEVQTPLTGHPAALLRVGDLVWFRPAASGELLDRVTQVHLLRGERFEDTVTTYRGLGRVD